MLLLTDRAKFLYSGFRLLISLLPQEASDIYAIDTWLVWPPAEASSESMPSMPGLL